MDVFIACHFVLGGVWSSSCKKPQKENCARLPRSARVSAPFAVKYQYGANDLGWFSIHNNHHTKAAVAWGWGDVLICLLVLVMWTLIPHIFRDNHDYLSLSFSLCALVLY